jgi:hypothetical protein
MAIPPSLPLLDAQNHSFGIDIANPEITHLRDAQSCPVGDAQCRLVFDAGRRVQKPGHFLLAQDNRQLARPRCHAQIAGQFRTIYGDVEEEAQSRDRAVDRRRLQAALALMELEAPQIVRRCAIRRAAEKHRKGSDMTNVILTRLLGKIAQAHILDHALTKNSTGLIMLR